jgi:hypothetical protein
MVHDSMLHFEMYSGLGKGQLTDRKRTGFERRPDLIDPTGYLNYAHLNQVEIWINYK